ncbi:hypothetical protein [Peptostreptococcus equinus]|uniref:Repeat domain-containing protein n=1 Tax=Peptostreptococcus equinus TaxID=3003601 RepID=A0ABY7JTC9_9FIRM|nr:hypothetical protein [Peptostreptococcus sp. CBA3647]WAW15736.1 hypothetical protein O0R46_04600 [Peptostreptococcus sp. CBA3647]
MLKIKRIILALTLIFMCSFLLVGCKTSSLKSPEKLVEVPVMDKDNKLIYDKIRNYTSMDTTFTMPQSSDKVGKINILDLDSDGKKDIIAFKKKETDSQADSIVYVYLFPFENNTISEDKSKLIKIPGDAIKYATFVDVDSDGKKEIVMQVQNRGLENIYIYKKDGNSIKKLAEYNSSLYSIRLNYFKYGRDNKEICLALLYNIDTYQMIIANMSYADRKIIFNSKDKIDGVNSFDRLDIINGYLNKNNKGSVILYKNDDGYTYSQLVTYENGMFTKILPDNSQLTKNTYSHKSYDIDRDNILEIPKIEFEEVNRGVKEASIITWNKWNGKLANDAKLIPSRTIYYNYTHNFKINLSKLHDKKIKVHNIDKSNIRLVSFFEDNGEIDKKPLFSIEIIDKRNQEFGTSKHEEELKNTLSENQDYIYVYKDNGSKVNDKININRVRNSFDMINK